MHPINQVTLAGRVTGRPQRRTLDGGAEVVHFNVTTNGAGDSVAVLVPRDHQPPRGLMPDDEVLVVGELGHTVSRETARTRMWDTLARLGLDKGQIRLTLEGLPGAVLDQAVVEPLVVLQAKQVTHIQLAPRLQSSRRAPAPRQPEGRRVAASRPPAVATVATAGPVEPDHDSTAPPAAA